MVKPSEDGVSSVIATSEILSGNLWTGAGISSLSDGK